MSFDLHATTAPAPKAPVTTTLDALAAAKWVSFAGLRYQLIWSDHTPEYADYPYNEAGTYFTCELYRDKDGYWIFDFWHQSRGGEQLYSGLSYEGNDANEALKEVRREMERWIDRRTEDAADAVAQRAVEGDGYE